ncbi:MAG: hypothetical protein HC802_14555 [Caldilineaceae bacterium]|nr:hypothetical protein [Caldilineaceae bacterium]
MRHHLDPELALATYDVTQLDPAVQTENWAVNSARALEQVEAARYEGRSLLADIDLADHEVEDLVAFLHALTDPCVTSESCLASWMPAADEADPDGERLHAVVGAESEDGAKPASTYSADVATGWFDLQLQLIKETPGFTPPVASRALAYASVALYESVVGGMAENNSLVGQLNDLEWLPQADEDADYFWAAVANRALAELVRGLYPTASPENLAAIDDLEQYFDELYRPMAGDEVFDRSVDGAVTGRGNLRVVHRGWRTRRLLVELSGHLRTSGWSGSVGIHSTRLCGRTPALLGSESTVRDPVGRGVCARSAHGV